MYDSYPQTKRPADDAFRQQRVLALQPLITLTFLFGSLLLVGVIFFIIGGIIVKSSEDVVQYSIRYDDICADNTTCRITFNIEKDIAGPVFVYYSLHNFYQNFRRVVKSRSDPQLRGKGITANLANCDPLKYVPGTEVPLYPCGLLANAVFNDSFRPLDPAWFNETGWTEKGIAWSSDNTKFKPLAGVPTTNNISINDEHFMVWMRNSGMPDFRKLYAIMKKNVPAGNFTFEIINQYPVEFGQKWLIISTASWIGGKNPFLGYTYIAMGVVCVVAALGVALKQTIRPRALGDMSYFVLPGAEARLAKQYGSAFARSKSDPGSQESV